MALTAEERQQREVIAALNELREASLKLALELNQKPERTDAQIRFIDAVIYFAGATSKH